MEVNVPQSRILLAVAAPGVERWSRILAGHEVMPVEHMADAIRRLDGEKFGMVIIGAYFDESQMFDLLHHVRMNRQDRTVPVLCFVGGAGRLSSLALEGLDHAVKALTANAFLDLRRMPDDQKNNARIRRIVDYLILIDGDLHQGLDADDASGGPE